MDDAPRADNPGAPRGASDGQRRPASPPIRVADVEVDLFGLTEDVCRIRLERGPDADTIHLQHDEYSQQDRSIALPACPGSDRDAAAAHLRQVVREGWISITSVMRPGVLGAMECLRIAEEAYEAWRADREAAIRAAHEAERRNPSAILAVGRALGLAPEPDGRRPHQWLASCPGAKHYLMLSTGTQTFGCGYCKAKGGPEELAAFVQQRRAGA